MSLAQAQVAFLQGERKGQENLKTDLVRRIKMLEYALKQERWVRGVGWGDWVGEGGPDQHELLYVRGPMTPVALVPSLSPPSG